MSKALFFWRQLSLNSEELGRAQLGHYFPLGFLVELGCHTDT